MSEINDQNVVCNAQEEFWDDLLAYIEEHKVIPVLGRELITVMIQGQEVPLFRAIAQRLLNKYGLDVDKKVVLRPHQELNDAVAALVQGGKRVQDLYRPINDLLHDIMRQPPSSSGALCDLASITNFDLFITTTFDDLFINTLNQVRSGGAKTTESIIYAPNLPANEHRDIPEIRPSNYHAVFYLFGRASASPVYAIHDEDTLEFLYNLLAGRSVMPERMIAEVRSRNLLLIGCNFADWLSRFFIRLSNQMRLSSGERTKKEFLVGKEVSQEESLTVFLEHFSQSSRLYPCDGRTFIKELTQRWHKRHPQAVEAEHHEKVLETGDIFISYSRTDRTAARTLYDELEKLGAGVIWFDKMQLEPGDEWHAKIMAAIKRCKWFLPLLSSTTESRVEGFFRKEWRAAAERAEMIQGRKFIIPVVVDQEYEGNADWYKLIPDIFRNHQFGHAPAGHMSDKLGDTIKYELRDLRRWRSS